MASKMLFKKIAARLDEFTAPNQIRMSLSDAQRILQSYYPDEGGSCIAHPDDLCMEETPQTGLMVSIIIPSYNNAAYVAKAIDSALAQKTNYDFEVIVVNDGSTDDTENVLKAYAGSRRVRIIHQENKGYSGARNAAIRAAKGEYLFFLDSDDTIPENALEQLLAVAVRENADIVEGNFELVWPDGTKHTGENFYKSTIHVTNKVSELSGFPCGKVIRRKLFRDVEFPDKYWFEDTVMNMVLYSFAADCWITDAVVYEYFINPKGITSQSRGRKKCLDSFYVTRRLLHDRCDLHIESKEEDYVFFLRQVKMNWGRTRYCPEPVRRAIFVCTCDLNKTFWGSFAETEIVCSDKKLMLLKQSLSAQNYRQYTQSMK